MDIVFGKPPRWRHRGAILEKNFSTAYAAPPAGVWTGVQPIIPMLARNAPIGKGVFYGGSRTRWEEKVNGLIYLIGLIVVILFILSFLGLR